MNAVLSLFAKAPIPGQVKTRLSPALSAEDAAAGYEAMLLDTLDQHRSLRGHDRVLWFAPESARAWFESKAAGDFALRVQQGDRLAARMRFLFQTHAAEGYTRMLLRGTDSPTLPLSRIEQAFAALEKCDIVICPDCDGGYNLIGLDKPHDEVFDLPMSTSNVLEATLERARLLGLRSEVLEPHYDVDEFEDLDRLEVDLDPVLTPRSLRWLRDLRGRIRG